MYITLTDSDVRKAVKEFLVKYNFATQSAVADASIQFVNRRKGTGLYTTVAIPNSYMDSMTTSGAAASIHTPEVRSNTPSEVFTSEELGESGEMAEQQLDLEEVIEMPPPAETKPLFAAVPDSPPIEGLKKSLFGG